MCACVFVFVSVWVRTCMQVWIHLCTHEQPQGFRREPFTLCLSWSHTDLELVDEVSLPGQKTLGICLDPPLWCWNYKHMSLCSAVFTRVLGIKLRFSGLHGKPFTSWTICPTRAAGFLKTIWNWVLMFIIPTIWNPKFPIKEYIYKHPQIRRLKINHHKSMILKSLNNEKMSIKDT